MSWMQRLHETYERCVGNEPQGAEHLTPVSHTTQLAHVEIVIDGGGNFRRARTISKENIVLPATEKSANRTSNDAPHALDDKIQYCAKDYPDFGGAKRAYFTSYLNQLEQWCGSEFSHSKAMSVLKYVRKGSVVADLVREGVLHVRNGVLLTDWTDKAPKPEIFKQLTPKTDGGGKVRDQGDALVRWVVEVPGELCAETWKDSSLQAAWRSFYASQKKVRGLCMVSGDMNSILADQHPAKLRNGADKAKLISSNDASGYTFRGKFFDADQAVGVSFEVTQKAHNALRWLIARQRYRHGDQVVMSWATAGKSVPDPFANTLDLFRFVDAANAEPATADTAQAFAIRLRNAIAGYRAELEPTDDIVVMGLDSATTGRMAITFYRELKGSELLERIESWHTKAAWHQNFGKDRRFIGAPAPNEIAEAAHGKRLDKKLRKSIIERLLPCIIDGQQIASDIVLSVIRHATNRAAFKPADRWEWEKCLGIACALFRSYHTERSYQMTLEQERTTRDYLYGRLLAIAEDIEQAALRVAGETRDTNAARLMQRFADRPCSTWKDIELKLTPYKSRLRVKRGGLLYRREQLLDATIAQFSTEDFLSDAPLSGEFLLGYHVQRRDLHPPKSVPNDNDADGVGPAN